MIRDQEEFDNLSHSDLCMFFNSEKAACNEKNTGKQVVKFQKSAKSSNHVQKTRIPFWNFVTVFIKMEFSEVFLDFDEIKSDTCNEYYYIALFQQVNGPTFT